MKKIILPLLLVFCFSFSQAQVINTIAGTGIQGYTGDGGAATSEELNEPMGVAIDVMGNIFISDAGDARIRFVNTSGVIVTIGGTGVMGYTGDGGPATAAEIAYPAGIAVDASGSFYFADLANNRIRKVNSTGIISTVVGNGVANYSGDGGQGTAAEISQPSDVKIDAAGNLYIVDNGNMRIRKVNTAGIISTLAGTVYAGYTGDGGPATSAELNGPIGIAFDAAGNMYIGDSYNSVIREINTSGIISTFAGIGRQGFSGDGGPATAAEFGDPGYLSIDASGNLYISDMLNKRIREINTSGIVNTVAGGGSSFANGIPATLASIGQTGQMAFDAAGTLYIADHGEQTVRTLYNFNCSNNFNEPICIATIDTATNLAELIWGRTNSPPATGGYMVYRDSASVYSLTHTQPLNALSEFIDPNSNPSAGPVSYELATFDSCGESALSAPHTTIFLTTTSNTNVYILNWTAYVGFTPSKYRIFRGPALNAMVQIDSVPSTTLTFHDTLPPINSYYAVEAVNPSSACIPTTKIRSHNISSVALSGSFSNGFNTGILTGENNINSIRDLKIYPNPSNGTFTIQSALVLGQWSVTIYNELGQSVYTKTGIGKINEQVNLENVAEGIYTLRLQTSAGNTVKKLMVTGKN